jgi:hypothetical protein
MELYLETVPCMKTTRRLETTILHGFERTSVNVVQDFLEKSMI